MKQDKHRFLRKRPGRKPGKAGSSLALVMMIGAALVIWVMCIMPLMTTTGTTAIQTEEKYDDYLESRSSIEYCKSELEKMVNIDKKVPSTFVVVKNVAPGGNVTYTAYPKIKNGSLSDDYKLYIKHDATDDRKDEPLSGDKGDLVTAICAVVPDEDDPGVYNITIQTYHSGEKGQVYKLKYTLSGSLLIYPESYNQNQALPLSDFVLVDGKLGDNEVWKSSLIEKGIGSAVGSDNGTGDFTEELLPYDLDKMKDIEYASSQEYPAVFKKTVDAASLSGTGDDHGTPLDNGFFTNETWTVPKASETKDDGSVWIQNDNGRIRVYLYANGEVHEITSDADCKVYLNGETYKDNLIPGDGYYSVTVDFDAKSYPKDDPVVNILPISGLSVGTVGSAIPTETQSLNGSSSVESVVQEESGTYKVTLADAGEGILYGYCSSQDGSDVKWVSEREISGLSGEKTYFFYICRPARMIDGVYYSDFVQYVGMIYPKTLERELTDGGKYLVLGGDGRDYAMTSSLKAQQLSLSNGFIIHNSNDSSIDALSWTVRENTDTENEWYFCSNDDKTNNPWLYMDGSYDNHGSFTRPKYEWELSLGSMGQKSSDAALAVKFVDETTASVTKRFEHKVWGFVVDSAIGYIAYSNNRFMATDTSSTVSFLKIPTVPNAAAVIPPTGNYTLKQYATTFSYDLMTFVTENINPGVERIVTLYANGSPVPAQTDGKYILAAGKYSLAADIVVDGIQYCVSLGDLTVNKYTFSSGYPMAVCTTDSSDEMTVHVSYTDGHDIGSKYWFGYREKDAKDFTWFPATSEDGLSRSFRLSPDKTYEFAVRECGTMNYNGCESTSPYAEWQVTPIQVELKATDENHPLKLQFSYDIDENGTPTWYALPNATAVNGGATVIIYPYRVHLVFGADDGNGGITWHEAYNSENDGYFGVYIDNSNYSGNRDSNGNLNLNAENAVLQIVQPINFSKSGGHTSSVMRGESLYFMGQSYTLDGESYSIRTYGNKIYLYTDLLVLKSGITGGTDETTGKDYPIGEVWVKPYSDGDDKDTLFFNPNENSITIGTTEFKGRTFYKIAPNTNLCNPQSSQIQRFGKLSSEDAYKAEKKEIQKLFREKVYPEINLDIAYADDAQLAHIISSETIGWTQDGVLRGTDSASNESYAVCAYVSKISSDVSYMANRVLIAAAKVTTPTGDFVCELNVPKNVTFGTRYLSIDADAVNKVGSGTFKINNLAQDQNFIDIILDKTKFNTYISKTLQIDFERSTSINGDKPVGPTICRYKEGDDLFGAGSHTLPLMADYTASEINSFFKNKTSSIIHSVDRYVTLKGDATVGTSISAWSTFQCKHDIYANYVYVDGITNITLFSIFDSDIRFHSQESGYREKEYLGLFTSHSADSYNGTLVYLKNDVQLKIISLWGWDSVTIKAGFYYVPATEYGTSISDLSLATYSITKEELAKIAVYVDPLTGEVKNAYVDTGIFDNISSGLGGFSGGNVG